MGRGLAIWSLPNQSLLHRHISTAVGKVLRQSRTGWIQRKRALGNCSKNRIFRFSMGKGKVTYINSSSTIKANMEGFLIFHLLFKKGKSLWIKIQIKNPKSSRRFENKKMRIMEKLTVIIKVESSTLRRMEMVWELEPKTSQILLLIPRISNHGTPTIHNPEIILIPLNIRIILMKKEKLLEIWRKNSWRLQNSISNIRKSKRINLLIFFLLISLLLQIPGHLKFMGRNQIE